MNRELSGKQLPTIVVVQGVQACKEAGTLTVALIGVNCRATSSQAMAFGSPRQNGSPGLIARRSREEATSSPVGVRGINGQNEEQGQD